MPTDPFDLAARFAAPSGAGAGDDAGDGDDADPLATDEAAYVCDACGEEIVIPVDLAAGAVQEYVEDCPVCCRPNVIAVALRPGGGAACTARAE